MRRCWIACGLLLAACALPTGTGMPAVIEQLPWTGAAADQTVLRARALSEQGDNRAALEIAVEVLKGAPRHVDANRLRQDILRTRGRRGLLIQELEQWLARDPDDALANYLRGRIAFKSREKLRWFRRASELAPNVLWGWLGLAHTLRQRNAELSQRLFSQLYEATDAHPIVAIAYVQALRGSDDAERTVEVCRTLVGDQRVPGVGDLCYARAMLASEDREAAWRALVSALRLRPFDPGVQSFVHAWIRAGASDEQIGELFDVLRAAPLRMAAFGRGDGALALAALLERHRQPKTALAALERSGSSARHPELRRAQRRLLLALGDTAGFLSLLRKDTPVAIVKAERNQLRGRWLTLLEGPWYDGDPLASPAQSEALLLALLRTGLVSEAEQLAETALERWPEDAGGITKLRDEARAELAFESGMRRLLYEGYRAGDTASLEVVTSRLRSVSERVFGRDVVGQPPQFEVPMVGTMLDPFGGTLADHLARYNRHLILGRRSGGIAEGMLLTRLSVAELAEESALPLPGRCFEVITVDRDVRAFSGVVGGDLAGIALLNHFMIDYDAVREWADSIAQRRRVGRADGGALVLDPLPDDPGFDPLDVAHRLAIMSPVQDADLDAAVLDTIRHHERQHLVDSFHYLPIEQNIGRGIGLLWQFGFSPALIEAEMERRAELASLALSPHTELVLAHIADFLVEPASESPHHRGFGGLARQLSKRLRELGTPAAAALPSRWHLLDMALVRRAARDLLVKLL